MTEPRRRTFSLADGEMAAIEFGDPARPIDVVFLHANGFNALTYRDGLSRLEGLRVLAADMRGHGRTRLPVTPGASETWYGFRDDLVALVEALELTAPAVFSGHSMGGSTALLATPLLPGRVKSLVLFDPVIPRPRGSTVTQPTSLVDGALRRRRTFDSKAEAVEAYVGRGGFRSWPKSTIADYVEDGFADAPEGGVTLTCTPEWEASNFAAQSTDFWPSLDALDRPMTILRAEHGSTCLIREGHPVVSAAPDRRVETVPGTSHFLPMERPDLVADALAKAAAAA